MSFTRRYELKGATLARGKKMTGKRTSYFSDRSDEERQLAENADDRMIARIHLDLAARYEELAESTVHDSPVSRDEIEQTGRAV